MTKTGGHTPLRNYLIEAMIDGRLSYRELRVVLALARATYGWIDPEKHGRRRDRADISQADVARMTGMTVKSVKPVIRTLMERNIITCYAPGAGRRKGIYGIQSDVDLWVEGPEKEDPIGPLEGPIRDGSQWALKRGPMVGPLEGPISGPKRGPLQASTISSEASDDKGLRPTPEAPKEIIKEIYKENYHEVLGVENAFLTPPRYQPINDAKAAIARNADLTTEEALAQAERTYTAQFAVPFSPVERMTLETYFGVSPFKGSLLAFWLLALPKASEDRRKRKADPASRRYVAKSPFRDVHAAASELYTDTKAEIEARKRAKAAPRVTPAVIQHNEIAPIRPLFAVEPAERSGTLLDQLRREGGGWMR